MTRSTSWQDPPHDKIHLMTRSTSWQDPPHDKILLIHRTSVQYFTSGHSQINDSQFITNHDKEKMNENQMIQLDNK